MPIDFHGLGRRVAAIRELRDLTQQELAEKAGLTQAAVARVEKARKPRVQLATVVAIAEALGVSVDYLLEKESDRNPLPAALALR